jgi:LAS superfamily LD-carboxypeptidase LdcB
MKNPISLSDAVIALTTANSFWVNQDGHVKYTDDYAGYRPTAAELNTKLHELQADYDSKQYQRDRATAYPSWQDQLDNIFHNGIDAWKADIQAIKDQYPKP